MQFDRLLTRFGKNLDINNPLPEYPRPQLKRDSYICLNGQWDYAILDKSVPLSDYQGKITVPFSPECILSGVERVVMPTDILYYHRTFTLPEGFNKGRILLNFDAVDYEATVFVNGTEVKHHLGGYFPFSIDITDAVKDGENELTLNVIDPSDTKPHARGKQKINRGGIFYTPQSGIWQTVWLESVPEVYANAIYLTPDIDTGTLTVKVDANAPAGGKAIAYDGDSAIAEGIIENGECVLKIDDAKLWSPESPFLYDLKITYGEDEITSYFGMRKFSVGKDGKGIPRIMLNNKPYFHNGLLDQGYWSDGLYTPASDEAMIYDIEICKKMGFNMLRKHIKIEPRRWYYHCDRLGMLVWQDFINGGMCANLPHNGAFGFLQIPVWDHFYWLLGRSNKAGRDEYYVDAERTIKTLYNTTSLAVWVPFNESWGQFDANKAVKFIKQFDTTRPIDHASGWHDQGGGDFKSWHIYFYPITFPHRDLHGRVLVLSEFGGYSVGVKGHVFNKSRSFGYKKFDSLERFENAYHRLFNREILHHIPKGLSATVYTQVSDVEDEINGLLTYDREVVKVDIDRIRELNAKLKLD